MHGDRQQRSPHRDQHQHHQGAAAEYPGQVAAAHRQQVAEEIAHQVDAHFAHEAQHHQAEGQGAVRQDPQQGVRGQWLALLQGHQQHGEQHAADRHGQRRADVQH
ncbi:hypothetical protein D3C72_2147160 [compost metagenome]